MLSHDALADVWARAGLDAPIRFDEVTGSTNAAAAELARVGAPEWTVVAAGHQTAGRGRLGRGWVDRPGAALLCSIVLRPPIGPEAAGAVPLLVGTALAEAIADTAEAAAGCKWPNDVLVDGRKAAGVLAEGAVHDDRIAFVVVGIGVNLGEPPLPDVGSVRGVGAPELLGAFLDAFVPRYRPAAETFAQDVVDAYRPWCVTLGRRVRATTTTGKSVEGEAVDLDANGGLLVDTGAEVVTVSFGEVEHLRPAR